VACFLSLPLLLRLLRLEACVFNFQQTRKNGINILLTFWSNNRIWLCHCQVFLASLSCAFLCFASKRSRKAIRRWFAGFLKPLKCNANNDCRHLLSRVSATHPALKQMDSLNPNKRMIVFVCLPRSIKFPWRWISAFIWFYFKTFIITK